jgi:hypothetical protein
VERKSETPWSRDKHDNMKLFIGKSKWETMCMPVAIAKWNYS